MVQKRNVNTYKSVCKDYVIRGTAKKIAQSYLGLSDGVADVAEKEMLLQHAEHWYRVEYGRA